MTASRDAEELLQLQPAKRAAALRRMTARQRLALRRYWRVWARPEQLPPPGPWPLWLIMAGRGFGKTRTGAEWVRIVAEADGTARIALVGSSLGEVRRVMVEVDSGLLAIAPARTRPRFEPSLRRLIWPGGATATLYSAGEPESLRGPQHSHGSGTGAEGSRHKRSAGPTGCAGPSGCGRLGHIAPRDAAGRRMLAGR